MKDLLRNLFSPILRPFESGIGEYVYEKSHRTILMVVGLLFFILSAAALAAAIYASEPGGLLPTGVFFAVGFVCAVVGFLGSDRAVARIWKSK